MAKTKKDLFYAIAKKIGGERGKRMREALRKCQCFDFMNRPLSDEEFARQLKNAERDLPTVLGSMEKLGPERPGSWGFPN